MGFNHSEFVTEFTLVVQEHIDRLPIGVRLIEVTWVVRGLASISFVKYLTAYAKNYKKNVKINFTPH